MQLLDQADILIQKHSKPEWFPKKTGVAIAKNFKELIQKDKLTIADLEGTRLEWLKVQYKIDVELEYYVSQLKAAVLSEAQWNSDEGDVSKPRLFERHISKSIKDRIPLKDGAKKRSDDKEYEFSYADLPKLSVNDFEDMYLLQVQDKVHHLPLEFMKDFNNALLMFIKRTMIKNMVEDIQLGVESYQRTLNLTKPTMFFEGIDQRIPF
ncbi:hypothetical protein Tco_0614970, partial [Tanacetum coccineum]